MPTAVPGLVSRLVKSPMVSPPAFVAIFQQLRQSEIQNLGGAAFGYENIAGLDVAVNDSFFVRRIQRVRQLNPDLDRPWNGK